MTQGISRVTFHHLVPKHILLEAQNLCSAGFFFQRRNCPGFGHGNCKFLSLMKDDVLLFLPGFVNLEWKIIFCMKNAFQDYIFFSSSGAEFP